MNIIHILALYFDFYFQIISTLETSSFLKRLFEEGLIHRMIWSLLLQFIFEFKTDTFRIIFLYAYKSLIIFINCKAC